MSALPFFIAPSSSAQATSQATQNTPVAVIAGNSGDGGTAGVGGLIDAVKRLQQGQSEPAEAAIANQSPLFGSGGGIPKWVWFVAAGVLIWAVVKRS